MGDVGTPVGQPSDRGGGGGGGPLTDGGVGTDIGGRRGARGPGEKLLEILFGGGGGGIALLTAE